MKFATPTTPIDVVALDLAVDADGDAALSATVSGQKIALGYIGQGSGTFYLYALSLAERRALEGAGFKLSATHRLTIG
ncbi:hypothetical protein DMC25_06540 [Caulobacter sp. D4A]|uniref:hypothetical protein n=1 Tax=unclassified Caulobacter TaxID=2648921 RepID=UPI000D7278BD|nr:MULTISPECIES: hypothetical protein [unclassified Caulobacter]PXA91206.1 hypothetical protein DMC25_06540 [Caulobacter sp. D4A]PXA96773.1 hypothetical protein DMC18_00480 [Caulobacter sp. D5]